MKSLISIIISMSLAFLFFTSNYADDNSKSSESKKTTPSSSPNTVPIGSTIPIDPAAPPLEGEVAKPMIPEKPNPKTSTTDSKAVLNVPLPIASGASMDEVYSNAKLYYCEKHQEVVTSKEGFACPLCNSPLVQMPQERVHKMHNSPLIGCANCPVVKIDPTVSSSSTNTSSTASVCPICNVHMLPIPLQSKPLEPIAPTSPAPKSSKKK